MHEIEIQAIKEKATIDARANLGKLYLRHNTGQKLHRRFRAALTAVEIARLTRLYTQQREAEINSMVGSARRGYDRSFKRRVLTAALTLAT